jgi:hypothetical protein
MATTRPVEFQAASGFRAFDIGDKEIGCFATADGGAAALLERARMQPSYRLPMRFPIGNFWEAIAPKT